VVTIPLATAAIAVVYILQYRIEGAPRTLLVAIHFLSVCAIIVGYSYLCFLHYHAGWLQIPGWTVFVLGSGLFWRATFRHSACLIPRSGYDVMAAGPYDHIRHPMYAGGVAAALGLLAVSPSREVLVAWLVLAVSLWCLIEVEERELCHRLGSNYVSYCERTKRLIPRLI
jgi:protein-S-isoprenylcysteine O-methyltransferase Ste14